MGPGDPPYGDLTVLGLLPNRRVLVQCACGSAPKAVLRGNVQSGRTRSCGCKMRMGEATMGLSGTPEYDAWVRKGRCPGWSNLVDFVRDLGLRPVGHALLSDGPSLSCGACEGCVGRGVARSARWAPKSVVASVATSRASEAHALRVTVGEEEMTVRQAAGAVGVSTNLIYKRLGAGTDPIRPEGEARCGGCGEPGHNRRSCGRPPVDVEGGRGRLRGQYRCGRCGGLGHNRRSCEGQVAAPDRGRRGGDPERDGGGGLGSRP